MILTEAMTQDKKTLKRPIKVRDVMKVDVEKLSVLEALDLARKFIMLSAKELEQAEKYLKPVIGKLNKAIEEVRRNSE